MPSTRRSRRARSASTVSALAAALVLALVPLSVAAEQLVRGFDAGAPRFWAALVAVQFLWAIGYAASSLPVWAKWPDGALQDRLTIVQGVVVSGLAGNIAYYGGFYYIGFAEIACFIGSGLAGWGGDKFLTPLLSRLTAAIEALTGRGPGENGGGGAKP